MLEETLPKSRAERQHINRSIIVVFVFAAIVNLPSTSLALAPIASATLTDVTSAGGTSYSFIVKYSDDGQVLDGTLDSNDIRVTGPAGFNVPAAFISLTENGAGNQVTGTYAITPPGGSWDSADNGTYNVVMQAGEVTDLLGEAVKAGSLGTFTVAAPSSSPTPAPKAALANISTRLRVETGDNVLIGGFIITGTQAKKIIVRAIGPSLPFADKLADPSLEFYQGNILLETNDNWRDSPNKQAIIDSTIPPTHPLESAIVRTVAPGAYTAVVRGAKNATGTAVVEAYDLDTGVDSKLANISTRGLVQTGDNVLFAGLIVSGQGTQRVIIRALGPSVGVGGAMADPSLELHDDSGAILESNDNWVDSPNKQAIIDSTIPPTNNLESAIVRILAPGNYTAIVRGANNATGISVVEVYALN